MVYNVVKPFGQKEDKWLLFEFIHNELAFDCFFCCHCLKDIGSSMRVYAISLNCFKNDDQPLALTFSNRYDISTDNVLNAI